MYLVVNAFVSLFVKSLSSDFSHWNIDNMLDWDVDVIPQFVTNNLSRKDAARISTSDCFSR